MQYQSLENTPNLSFTFSQNRQSNIKTEKYYKHILLGLIVLACVVTPTKIIYQCAHDQSMGWIIENNIYLFLLFLLNMTCIIIYIYAQFYFSKYYQRQIVLNQDIIHENQIVEMKRSVKFLTFFMYTLSIIILFRLVVSYIYELSFTYDLLHFQLPGVIALSTVIYLTEIVLTFMMSLSIKETTKTSNSLTICDDQTPHKIFNTNFLEFDLSQGEDLLQDVDQDLLKMTAFQVIDDVTLSHNKEKINPLVQ